MPVAYGLLDPLDVNLPTLNPALDGFRIAHVTDLHIHRRAHRHKQVITQLQRYRFDLLVLTGDLIHRESDTEAGFEIVDEIAAMVNGRAPMVGVFGNHDHHRFRDLCRDAAEDHGITWLANDVHRLEESPIDLLGVDMDRDEGDVIALATARGVMEAEDDLGDLQSDPNARTGVHPRLRVLLAHNPEQIHVAADLGATFAMAGHTHGGQIRTPGGRALINGVKLPLGLSSGLLRHRQTLMAVSRGVGEGPIIPRVFCRPHVPIYTLRRGPMSGRGGEAVVCVRPW